MTQTHNRKQMEHMYKPWKMENTVVKKMKIIPIVQLHLFLMITLLFNST